MRVLVAGATGALGQPTIKKLVEQGHEVFGLTRSQKKAGTIAALGAQAVFGDVLDRAAMDRVVDEVKPDTVVQLLNDLPKRGPLRPSEIDSTNVLRVEGTANLLGAATNAGVKRYLVESMIFGYGYGNRGREALTEDAAFGLRVGNDKMNSALDALRVMERMVLDPDEHPQTEGVVLRLGLFYGPEVGSTQFMASLLRKRMMFLPGGGKGKLSWIHIEDGASAIAKALTDAPAGAIYNVVDDEPVGFGDLAAEMARVLGVSGPKSIPVFLAKMGSSYAAQMAQTDLRASNEKIKRELGWKPAYPTYREGALSVGQTAGRGSKRARRKALT